MSVSSLKFSDREVDGIVDVYRKSFGGEPWNEGYKCLVCDSVYPLQPIAVNCPTCLQSSVASTLVEYWPESQVRSDFYAEMAKAGAVYVVKYDSVNSDSRQVVGFAWGYDIQVDQDAEAKLQAPGLSDIITGTFFYLDECAVTPDYQGQGLGKELVNQIFAKQPRSNVMLRTLDNSRMCNLIRNLGGEVVLKISRDRVIMKLNLR